MDFMVSQFYHGPHLLSSIDCRPATVVIRRIASFHLR